MSSFFSAFGKSSSIKPNAPTVRKETRPVEKPKPVAPPAQNGVKRTASPANPAASRTNGTNKTAAARQISQRSVETLRTPTPRKSLKRKSESPAINVFGSSSEGESDEERIVEQSRKKAKTTASPIVDRERRIRDQKNWMEEDSKTFSVKHGEALTTGEFGQGYETAFTLIDDPAVVELQYPSASQKERFKLMFKKDEYDPLADIKQSIIHILQYYLPPSQSEALLDPSTGIPYRLSRALNHNDFNSYRAAVDDFNKTIEAARADGTIAKVLDNKTSPLPLPLVERILSQVYQHTVSPAVKTLSAYKPASDNVYGELEPPFSSQIFRDASLTSSSVFLDLGSGVGNVVLQAALEFGAESWGIEMMTNPAGLADAQAAEFPSRCRMWGLGVGDVHLMRGDFREDERVRDVLRRADVVLVNNQAFTSDLNTRIAEMLLDLKDGARVVSLKSFVPSGFKLTDRTIGSVVANFDVEMKTFWSGWVSWKDEGGTYFMATKDEGRVKRFLERKKT